MFALFDAICVVKCQICDSTGSGVLPQKWHCDGVPHTLSNEKEAIENYCGYSVNPTSTPKTGPKVSNGRPATPGELPFAASIAFDGLHSCGAALIDNYHLITAAHCVLLNQNLAPNGNGVDPNYLEVQMGTIYRYGTTAAKNDKHAIIRKVDSIKKNPLYRQGYYDSNTRRIEKGVYGGNDIAIIVLVEPMPFTENIWPICLASEDVVIGAANQKTNPIILSGFGQDTKSGNTHIELQVSKDIRLMNDSECQKSIDRRGREFKNGQMCTVGVNEEKTAGACKGDSGSALVQQLRGRHYILGVVSYGPGDCFKGSTIKPDVYTDVRVFLSWISDYTANWEYSSFYNKGKINQTQNVIRITP